ncbi:hypothetical protein [Haloglycomyces albus]|uniref:hypothetical protein n=1 Tax=Haloglycomyces albus TaxID=526067 RepID=UPI0004B9ED3A|nr:hypothetical protein [Haloglycomyces albus]
MNKMTAFLPALGLLATVAACGSSESESQDSETDTDANKKTATAALIALDGTEAAGSSQITVSEEETTVELTITEMNPDTDYTSHLHDSSCEADPPGGEHWLADPEAGMGEDNEIHLHLTTDDSGEATVTTSSPLEADDRVKSIVVHTDAPEGHDHAVAGDRVLCGDVAYD